MTETNKTAPPRLRELKKQRTRQRVLDAAFALFTERGYSGTTLEDIASAAEISTGTLFSYFPTKDSILFPEETRFYQELRTRLSHREPGTTTFDVLRDHLGTLQQPDARLAQRLDILKAEREWDIRSARNTRVNQLLADSIAADLGTTTDDLRTIMLVAATSAALTTAGETLEPNTGRALRHHDAIAILEHMLRLLQSELNTLRTSEGVDNASLDASR